MAIAKSIPPISIIFVFCRDMLLVREHITLREKNWKLKPVLSTEIFDSLHPCSCNRHPQWTLCQIMEQERLVWELWLQEVKPLCTSMSPSELVYIQPEIPTKHKHSKQRYQCPKLWLYAGPTCGTTTMASISFKNPRFKVFKVIIIHKRTQDFYLSRNCNWYWYQNKWCDKYNECISIVLPVFFQWICHFAFHGFGRIIWLNLNNNRTNGQCFNL